MGSRPSFPMPSEPNLRRLGLGGGRGGGDRPIRAQVIVAVVVIGLLIAIPLYVFRSPDDDSEEQIVSPAASAREAGQIIRTRVDAGAPSTNVRLGPIQRVKCSSSSRSHGNEGSLCDSLGQLEADFGKSVSANVDCAPKTGQQGTINYVLEVDFTKQRLHVFPGASGSWKGKQAKRAAQCVQQSMPEVKWETLPHRYRYYMLAVLATYPAPNPLEGLPEFE